MSEIDKPTSTSETISEVDSEQSREVSDAAFIARRRQLAKLGFGAPILATLASRPVFAGQCLSNMMSGNLSNPNRGNCSKGWSPGGWGQLGGNVHIYTTINAWTAIGFNYNTATMANVPPALNKDGVPQTTLLKTLIMVPQTGQLTRHFVCAYFNAKLSALSGSTFMYILTTQQVLDMATGAITIPLGAPGYPGDFNTFFDSTWN